MSRGVPILVDLRASTNAHDQQYVQHTPAMLPPRVEAHCIADAKSMVIAQSLWNGVFGLKLKISDGICHFMKLNTMPTMWPLLHDLRFQMLFAMQMWDYGKMAILTAQKDISTATILKHSLVQQRAPLRLSIRCNASFKQMCTGRVLNSLANIWNMKTIGVCKTHVSSTMKTMFHSMPSFVHNIKPQALRGTLAS
mmetsp:Transcript_39827/g.66059  ORF Transcript_39827/g.66059 Transcript_39827/m.66059 type:complete len:195 (+) Transcript_39827:35-619(+)